MLAVIVAILSLHWAWNDLGPALLFLNFIVNDPNFTVIGYNFNGPQLTAVTWSLTQPRSLVEVLL